MWAGSPKGGLNQREQRHTSAAGAWGAEHKSVAGVGGAEACVKVGVGRAEAHIKAGVRGGGGTHQQSKRGEAPALQISHAPMLCM